MLVKNFKIEMDPQTIRRYLGVKKSHGLPGSSEKIVDRMITEAYSLIEPIGYFRIDDLNEVGYDYVKASSGLDIKTRSVAKLFDKCSLMATMLVSIGYPLEREASKLMDSGEMAEGVILDAIGSDAVEKVADHVNLLVQHEAHHRGLHLTTRYSPGFGDWGITGQEDIFKILDHKAVGVSLHESFFMEPRKSVSAIIGIGEHDKIRRKGSPCKHC